MAVMAERTIKRWRGLSIDRKPYPGELAADGTTPGASDIPDGSVFYETDTGATYIWWSHQWHLDGGQLAGLLREVRDTLKDTLAEVKILRASLGISHDTNGLGG